MQGSEGLPPGSIPVKCGDVLAGKYRVDRILGIGGMGIVVAATHLQLDQRVALKFMLPEALRIPALVERFAREARAAVRLRSEHVARVLDVGTLESGSPYMVMEYLEGDDLGSLIENLGSVPVNTAVDFVLQACDAVAEAHSMGIVHRDLKPRNLFLTRRNDGRALVKVLDFGIAKQKGAGGDLSLTKSTDVMGSPNYMSPEQLRASRAADERSDIWALGVILYELLSGALPFAAESVTQLIAMVLTERPRPIRAVRNDVPDGLSGVIERCLQKDPAARFASIAELAAALDRFAPPDARDLVQRIARITSGRSAPGMSQPSGKPPVRTPGGTTANWWARTELAARSSRVKLIAVTVSVSVVSLASFIAVAAALRLSRQAATLQGSGRAEPVATVTTPATLALVPAVAATSLPTALPFAAAPVTASAGPAFPADAGAGRLSRPRREVAVPVPNAPVSEGPQYRTSW